MSNTRTQLLDRAEADIRLRGFHAVSFRDLADSLGIKSASVHYHFPQKQDLGLALVERYQQRFFAALPQPEDPSLAWPERLAAFQQAYQAALEGADRICLCGILGAESGGLPDPLAHAVAAFFNANIDWLTQAMPPYLPKEIRTARATAMVAALQGAMMMSVALGDQAVFHRTLDGLEGLALRA